MLSTINIVMVGLLAVCLIFYLLRRRTRIVTTQLNIGADTEGADTEVDQASSQTTAS